MDVVAELVAWRQAPPRLLDQSDAGAAPRLVREDRERLFGLLATRAIPPRVAERISFDEVAEAHHRLEAGGLEGKLVLCPDLPSRRDRVPPQCEPRPTSVQTTPPRAEASTSRRLSHSG
jgi:Zinc-binding dehydrogenase